MRPSGDTQPHEGDDAVFSYSEFENVVRRFSGEVLGQLIRHDVAVPFGLALDRLRIAETLNLRFTVAVVGQMRVGKSTLVNAIIGRDLAPVGVTETTATINWFRFGSGDECDAFRVSWLDGSTSDIPLTQVGAWLGSSINATRTRCIDFFADTEFLRIANVVDTPGTRSVIQSHEDATQSFLAERHESQTLAHGGRADAVVYAINPVGKESDRDLLQLFGQRTRLPGAAAFNSIAVLQKWEHLLPNPFAEASRKCEQLKSQLEGKVATVIPTSGLLSKLADTVEAGMWQSVADVSRTAKSSDLECLLLSEADFAEGVPSAPLTGEVRAALLKAISWKVLPTCVRLARAEEITSGSELRARIRELSGIPALRTTLKRQFFSRAALIKASTALRKAWEPCAIAVQTIRRERDSRRMLHASGGCARAAVEALPDGGAAREAVRRYISESLSIIESDIAELDDIERKVDANMHQVSRCAEMFDADILSLQLLESHRAAFAPDEGKKLDRLFGQFGPEVWTRLGLAQPNHQEALDTARDQFSYWALQRARSIGIRAQICTNGCNVLDRILNWLER